MTKILMIDKQEDFLSCNGIPKQTAEEDIKRFSKLLTLLKIKDTKQVWIYMDKR